MFEIKKAKYLGTCFGVDNALKEVKEIAEKDNEIVYTIGPIIHNPIVVDDLKKRFNVIPVSDIKGIDHGIVVIRTHGIDPKIIKKCKEKGLKVIDGTCPFVKRVQEIAKKLIKENYNLVIIGEKEHPEIKGIQANIDNKGIVIENIYESKNLPYLKKIGIVVQTTQSIRKFREIISEILLKGNEIRIYNTICSATLRRQESAIKLAKEVDLMIVIGGKNSGNTKRLTSICSEIVNTLHVEDYTEINEDILKGIKKVGITAGASTPDYIIDRIVERLRKYNS
jgi:4-hydroxy-3-methylbut-2-enyl diphosphate reductase